MGKIADEFEPIFDELAKMRTYVQLLEQEVATERAETVRLRNLVRQMKEHAMLIAEEGERGEPIETLDGEPLHLIDPSVDRDLSLKLRAIEKQAPAHQSSPNNGVTPDWLVAAMPTTELKHDTTPEAPSLNGSYILSKD